eukprot:scaffold113912_cov27-Phaeocystis_antarctica.AAC.1
MTLVSTTDTWLGVGVGLGLGLGLGVSVDGRELVHEQRLLIAYLPTFYYLLTSSTLSTTSVRTTYTYCLLPTYYLPPIADLVHAKHDVAHEQAAGVRG